MSGLPSWFTSLTVGEIVTTVLAFGTMLGALWFMTRPMRTAARTIEQLREDWFGVPGRPGFKAVPGVPERLAQLEEWAEVARELLEKINHELHPNSGGSMRDQLDQARRDMDRVAREAEKLSTLSRDVESMRRALENPRTLHALARRLDTLPGDGDDEQPKGA